MDSFGTLAERLDGNRGTVMKDEYHNKNIMDAVEVMYKTKARLLYINDTVRAHVSDSQLIKSSSHDLTTQSWTPRNNLETH